MSGGKIINNSPAAIGTLQIQTSSYGNCIPWAFGTTRISPNLIQYEDFKSVPHTTTQGSKGGPPRQANTTYTYSACLLLGICSGVIASIPRVWKDKNITTLSGLNLDLYTGSNTQTPYPYLTTNHSDRALGYRGISYAACGTYDLGTGGVIGNHSFEVITTTTITSLPDANISSVITALLTDAEQGLGLPAARIGDLTQFTNFCLANGIWVSPCYNEQKPAYELIKNLLMIGFSDCFRSNGILQIVPYSDVSATNAYGTFTPTSPVPLPITEDDILDVGDDPVRMTRKLQSESFNHVQVKFRDRSNDYNDDITEQKDDADIEVFGLRSMPVLDMPEICDVVTAGKVAAFILHRSLNVRNEYEFTLPWKFARLEPMDLLAIYYPRKGHNGTPVLITDIKDSESGDMLVIAEDYPLGTNHAMAKPPATINGYTPNNNIAPGNTTLPVVFEAPMALTGNVPQIWLAASGGVNWGGCSVWVSTDNATYEKVGVLNQKSRYGVTTSAITSGASPDTVNVAGVDISASGGSITSGTNQNATDLITACYLGGEYIAYGSATLTAAGKYNLSYLVRGAYGSQNAAHASGVPFVRLDGSIFEYSFPASWLGKTIYIKLVSFNIFGNGDQDISTISATTYTIVGAPLGTVQNLRSPTGWTYGESAKTLWDPLSGAVSYDIQVYQGATLVRTVLGVVSNNYDYTPQDMVADGGPWRAISIYVRGRSATGSVGLYNSIALNNPQVGALSSISVNGGIRTGFFSCAAPIDLDFAGIIVWLSTASNCPATAANQVYDGPSTFVTLSKLQDGTALVGGSTYYYRVAGYDTFGKDSLTYSAIFSFVVVASAPDANSITAAMIQSGVLDATKFATGIEPVTIVATVPSVKSTSTIFVTADQKLYRWNGTAYVTGTAAADVSGTFGLAQIPNIPTTQLSGLVQAAQIQGNSITAAQIAANTITANQMAANSITTSKMLVTSKGQAINDDPAIEDASAWVIPAGVTILHNAASPGTAGANYFTNSSAVNATVVSARFHAVDPAKTYTLTANILAAAGNNRPIYLLVEFRDISGAHVATSSPNWGAAYSGYVYGAVPPGDGVLHRVGGPFGAGTVNPIPSNAVSMQIGFISQSSDAGTSSVVQAVQDIRLERVNDASLIVDGAIIASKLAADSVIAGKIAAAAISAREISAGAITASKLAIGDFENLVANPSGYLNGVVTADGWGNATSGKSAGVFAGGSPEPFLFFTQRNNPIGPYFKVNPGDQFYFEFTSQPSGGGAGDYDIGLGLVITGVDPATNIGFPMATVRPAASTGIQTVSGLYTIPAGVYWAQIFLLVLTSTSSAGFYLKNIQARRVTGSTLIQDGAITTIKMTAASINADRLAVNTLTGDRMVINTITGDKIQATTITADKMNVTSISAISGNLGTMTAAIIQSGASGQRTVTTQLGVRVYDTAGTLRVIMGDLS